MLFMLLYGVFGKFWISTERISIIKTKFCGFEQCLAAQYAFVITGSFTRHIDYMIAFVLDVTLIYLCILFKFIKHYWKAHLLFDTCAK